MDSEKDNKCQCRYGKECICKDKCECEYCDCESKCCEKKSVSK